MFNLQFFKRHNYIVRTHTLEHKGDFLFLNEKASAKRTFERESVEIIVLFCAIFLVTAAIVIFTMGAAVFWVLIFSAAFCFYFASLVFKMFLTITSLLKQIPSPTSDQIYRMSDSDLPPYTVLVPLYKEGEVLREFVEHFQTIDYPKEKLDVRLLLEEDDIKTLNVARSIGLKPPFSLVTIPRKGPRTKPKALNVGVIDSESEILTIYDAEDRPDVDQLKKVAWAFRNLPKNVVCIQAKLMFYNAHQNILTKWFAAEYNSWFNYFLPALYYFGFPIPLGGTSNHFKTSVLKEIGGWDPYNVTEDADLGIRISRLGYRISMIESYSSQIAGSRKSSSSIAIINSSTPEEATSMFFSWFRQRTRWLKGYMQTAVVHLRYPREAMKDLSWKGFLAFIFFVVGTPFAHLLNLAFWVITIFWLLDLYALPYGIPDFILWGGFASLVLGNFLFIALHVVPMMIHKEWEIALPAIFIPIYWLMMSIAAVRAVFQLLFHPHYWEKTSHGLTKRSSLNQNLVGATLVLALLLFFGFGAVKVYSNSFAGDNVSEFGVTKLENKDLWTVPAREHFPEEYLFVSEEAAVSYGNLMRDADLLINMGASREYIKIELNRSYKFTNVTSGVACLNQTLKCFDL